MHEFSRFHWRSATAATVAAVFVVVWLTGTALAQSATTTLPETGSVQSDIAKTITINVQVSDRGGHPVPGLLESDFTLLDNKQPQKLLGFRPVDANTLKIDPAHVIIVVDMINADVLTVAREREEVGRFLKQNGGELANPTTIGVMADSGVKIGPRSTQNGNSLQTAFAQTRSEIRELGRDTGIYGAVERMQRSLQQLNQLLDYEGQQPGRKLLLLVSPGWPLLSVAGEQADMQQRSWVFNRLVHLTNLLREANITLYCIDPHDLGRTNPFEYRGYLKSVTSAKDATYPDISLQVLATHSGGEAMINGRDISGNLEEAVHDASPSYELMFAPAPGDRANEFHALEVRVDKPGLQVRTTTGYYARMQATQ